MHIRIYFTLFFLISLAKGVQLLEENGVFILNEGNFAGAVAEKEFLLVVFYARKRKKFYLNNGIKNSRK
jgi:hypothetical protein